MIHYIDSYLMFPTLRRSATTQCFMQDSHYKVMDEVLQGFVSRDLY